MSFLSSKSEVVLVLFYSKTKENEHILFEPIPLKQVLLFDVVLNAYSHTHLILSAALTSFSVSV